MPGRPGDTKAGGNSTEAATAAVAAIGDCRCPGVAAEQRGRDRGSVGSCAIATITAIAGRGIWIEERIAVSPIAAVAAVAAVCLRIVVEVRISTGVGDDWIGKAGSAGKTVGAWVARSSVRAIWPRKAGWDICYRVRYAARDDNAQNGAEHHDRKLQERKLCHANATIF